MFYRNITARRAAGTNGMIFFQFPNATLEAELFFGDGTDRTNVCHVSLKFIRHRSVCIGIHGQFMSTVKHAEFVGTGDFPGKSVTARALYATVTFQGYKSTNVAPAVNPFRIIHFRFSGTIFESVVLKSTFSGLITDRTIERVINQQKFVNKFPSLFNFFVESFDLHAFRDINRTSGLEFWCRSAITKIDHIHQTHSAGGDYRHSGMVAIMRDYFSAT